MKSDKVRLIRLPFLLPRWAIAQVLLPRRVFVRRDAAVTQRLLAHELVHVDQLERLGPLRYWWTYLVLLLRCGYREHPMELDAIVRSAEPEFLDAAALLLKGTPRETEVRSLLASRPVDLN
ncbi:MAG TPA: hypothetical protein VF168_04210 [Trueperaceae bacterium]